jgi:hypothetical protein
MNQVLLLRFRLSSFICFFLLLVWLLLAVFGDIYLIRPQALRALPAQKTGIDYGQRKPVGEYLSLVGRREMFKQSVLYETKSKEVVNALDGFVFIGVMGEGKTLQSFILNSKTNQTDICKVGDNIGDCKIQEIREDAVIVIHGEETLELRRK